MTPAWLVPLLLLLAAPALAADYEVNLEAGTVHNGDVSWDVFSKHDAMPSLGVRIGAPIHDRVALVASWHHIRRGRDLYVDQDLAARAAFLGEQIQLGAKADLDVAGFFHPYVTAQGLVLAASWRFDDDPTDKTSPVQMRSGDVSYGALGTLGVEFQMPDGKAPVRAAVYVEAGYTWIAEMVVCPVGNMSARGFSATTGVGVRF